MNWKKLKIFELIGVIGVATSIVFGINQWNSNNDMLSYDEYLKLINNYYSAVLDHDYDRIESFYAIKIDRFFEAKNLDFSEIKRQISKYNEIWKFQELQLDKSSLVITPRENGYTQLRYEIDYKIKKSKSDVFKKYDLEISLILNSNNKIVSIFEEKK